MVCKVTFLKEPELICLPTVKWFHCQRILLILFNNNLLNGFEYHWLAGFYGKQMTYGIEIITTNHIIINI